MQLNEEKYLTYSVKEVCELTGLSRSTVRRYEKDGLVMFEPLIALNGRRSYTQAMVDEIVDVNIKHRKEKYREGLMAMYAKLRSVARKLKEESETGGLDALEDLFLPPHSQEGQRTELEGRDNAMVDCFEYSPDGESKGVDNDGGCDVLS